MPADHDAHWFAERGVGDFLLGVGDLGVEALRVADREFEVATPGQADQLVGFVEGQGNGLFQKNVLAGAQAVARNRIMRALRRGGDVDRLDAWVGDDVAIVEGGAGRLGEARYFRQTVGSDFTNV